MARHRPSCSREGRVASRSSTCRPRPAPRSPRSSVAPFLPVNVTDYDDTRSGDQRCGRSARRHPHLGQHRRRRHRHAHADQGGPAPARGLPRSHRPEPDRSFNISRLAASHMSKQRARGRRARRDHQHRVDRRVRGPDRPGGLHRGQGRHRGHVPDDGARPRQPRHPRAGHRAEPVQHGPHQGHPRRVRGALTKDAAFPKRMGRPDEYGKLAVAIVENPMLNGQCIRLDAGQRFAPK